MNMDFLFKNMEWIVLSNFLWVVNLLLAFTVLVFFVNIGKTAYGKSAPQKFQNIAQVLWNMKGRIVLAILWLGLVVTFINGSYLYRPKNVIETPALEQKIKSHQDEQMKAKPVFKESKPAPTWEEKVQKNKADQDAAAERFKALPQSE